MLTEERHAFSAPDAVGACARRRRFRRLRALLQETTGQLASKASELADLLGQAFDPAAGASESIGTYLAASSAARNVTAVAANATGLGGEATAAVLTDEVDPLKAMQAQVTGLVSSMKTQQASLSMPPRRARFLTKSMKMKKCPRGQYQWLARQARRAVLIAGQGATYKGPSTCWFWMGGLRSSLSAHRVELYSSVVSKRPALISILREQLLSAR